MSGKSRHKGMNHPVMFGILLFLVIIQAIADIVIAMTSPGGTVGAVVLTTLIAGEIGFDFFIMLFMVLIIFLTGSGGQREVK